MAAMHRLITIPFSHYNEKARWALDRWGVPYREERYMPMFHFVPTMAVSLRHGMGRADKASTPFSTPLFITAEGECVRDSSDIVRWVSDRFAGGSLYPTPEVAELEQHFHDDLGPHTRRAAYFFAFGDPSLLGRIAAHNVGPLQARLFQQTYRLVTGGIARALHIERATAEQSIAQVREVFAEVGERMRGRRYLVGDTFTAADLAFACMAAPGLLVSKKEGFGAWLPTRADLPAEAGAMVDELRASDAGRYALRMFAEERGRHRAQ